MQRIAGILLFFILVPGSGLPQETLADTEGIVYHLFLGTNSAKFNTSEDDLYYDEGYSGMNTNFGLGFEHFFTPKISWMPTLEWITKGGPVQTGFFSDMVHVNYLNFALPLIYYQKIPRFTVLKKDIASHLRIMAGPYAGKIGSGSKNDLPEDTRFHDFDYGLFLGIGASTHLNSDLKLTLDLIYEKGLTDTNPEGRNNDGWFSDSGTRKNRSINFRAGISFTRESIMNIFQKKSAK